MPTDESAAAEGTEEVVEETINAYHVQKLADGRVRIENGGHVVIADTYLEALERHAIGEREHMSREADSIHDGYVPLKSMDSTGFTPEAILDAVTTANIYWHVEKAYEVEDGE